MTGISSSESISTKQARIANLARQMKWTALHSLSRHLDRSWLHEAHRRTRKGGAVGVDGQTGWEYEEELESNLDSLLRRAHTGSYRAPLSCPPSRKTLAAAEIGLKSIHSANGESQRASSV